MKLGFVLHLIVISILASLFALPKGSPTARTEPTSQKETVESVSINYLREEL